MNEMGDDHFGDFIREVAGIITRAASRRRYITEEAINLGFASIPDLHHVKREVCPYNADGVDIRAVYERQWRNLTWYREDRNPCAIHICGRWRRYHGGGKRRV